MPKQGFISASMAKAVMTKGRGNSQYGATFESKAQEIAAMMLGYDITADLSGNPHIERGLEYEPVAIQAYERFTNRSVHSSQEWIAFKDKPFGCTPDGLVGDDGMIEVKCPTSSNHLKNILSNAQLKDYEPQMQFSLGVTGRAWCDFISYDDSAPDGLKLHVHRLMRDDEMIATLFERAKALHKRAVEISLEIQAVMAIEPATESSQLSVDRLGF